MQKNARAVTTFILISGQNPVKFYVREYFYNEDNRGEPSPGKELSKNVENEVYQSYRMVQGRTINLLTSQSTVNCPETDMAAYA